MNRTQFRQLVDSQVLVLDGATGSNLMDAGMPLGVCPEKWILEHPKKLIDLQTSFIEAGSNIVYAPTFTCNRIKLQEYHLEDETVRMNKELVALSKEVIAKNNFRGYVAGDMTMTGRQLYPIGDIRFEQLVPLVQCNFDDYNSECGHYRNDESCSIWTFCNIQNAIDSLMEKGVLKLNGEMYEVVF